MYKMHMYHNGILPVVQQRYHAPRLDLLRCSYWVLRLWNHTNLASPYWRLYWNADIGAEVTWMEARFPLDPDHLLLIAPNTPFTTRFRAGAPARVPANTVLGCPAAEWDGTGQATERVVHHFFVHFIAGLPYDAVAPQVFRLPLAPEMRAGLAALTATLAGEPHTLTHQQSFHLHTLLYTALGAVPDAQWPAPPADERIVTVMHYIDEHYAQPLTNADFATLAAMSAKAFVRLFKATTGQTPLDYLLRRRMETASILLHHTDESIERIAERCGFYDRHHFSKLFQRHFNLGPATYRKTRML